MNRFAKIHLLTIFILSCNSPSFDSPCDSRSSTFVKAFTLKLALNDQSQYCGISSLKTNSNSNGVKPTVSSISPLNNSTNFTIGTPITITFDKTMNTQTLTIQSTDGTCSGSIQISSNSFTSCLGGTLSFSTDQKTASITIVTPFCVESSYSLQIKATTSAKDTQGNALVSNSISSTAFQTQQALLKVGATGGTGVNAIAVSCNTLYIAGSFTTVGSSTRNNVAAIDLINGHETATVPGTNNIVSAIAVSGSSIYIGGSFTNAGGQARNNIAALDTTTGLATSWNPNATGVVNAIAISGNTMYVGGNFTNIGGQARNRIATLDISSGLAGAFNPGLSAGVVSTVAYDSTNLYVGGTFSAATIGGLVRSYIAAIDIASGLTLAGWCATGASLPVNFIMVNSGIVYIVGSFGGSLCGTIFYNFGAVFASTGATSGFASGGGTGTNNITNAVALGGSSLYVGGAFTGGSSFISQTRNYAGASTLAGAATSWDPNPNNVVNAVVTLGTSVFIGGTFTTVNGGTSANRIALIDATTGILRP